MISPRLRRLCLALTLPLLLLSGCASFKSVPPGTPYAQVQAEFGRPNYTCPLPDGGQRVIWSGQPFGQFAWGTNVDSQGRVGEIQQLLTDEHFRVLDEGTWTAEQVLCEFGPPAETESVGMPSVRQVVWSYRYQQSGVWNSLMYVYLGRNGDQVTRHHPGPDPMYERDRFLPF